MIHLITGEYPPAAGGVADYTAEVATALATAGAAVHVWCPGEQAEPTVERGVTVHRALAVMGAADFQRMDAQLDRFLAPRRLLVQWVPHAFGRRSMNLGFCQWLARRAGAGDCVEIMVHEPFLPFAPRPRQFLAAAVHRVMTIVLLRAARMVWVATPAWEARWRPYAFGRNLPFHWLPEPASVPVDPCAAGRAASIRMGLVPPDGCIIGAFSTASPFAREMLAASVPMALERSGSSALLLVGKGSQQTRDVLAGRFPALARRMHATGSLDAPGISAHLSACDLAVQPYPDGICTRHSSAMTVLAHGVPMVTTGGRFTEEIWRNTRAVSLVSPCDGPRMASAIEELLAAPREREAQRRRAVDLYDARFDVRHTVSALLAVAAGGL